MANGPDALERGDPMRGQSDDTARTSQTSIWTTSELRR
jgi:hypothetical protein